MKYIFLVGIVFCNYTIIFSQDRTVNMEMFSKKLGPYRKHLDSVYNYINATYLLDLYKRKVQKGDTLEIPKKTIYTTQNRNSNHSLIEEWLYLTPYKYPFNSIIKMDTNNIGFIEVQYELSNRLTLAKYRNQYHLTTSPKEQIQILLKYVKALNESFPRNPQWNFSKSYTLRKHKDQIKKLFKFLPNNFDKADLLLEYGNTLQAIGLKDQAANMYGIYIEAETILLSPYWKGLEGNHEQDNYINYKKYITKNNLGNRMVGVLGGIYIALNNISVVNRNNDLYSFSIKKHQAIDNLINIYKILSEKDKSFLKSIDTIEIAVLAAYTTERIDQNAKSAEYVLGDKLYALEGYISKILVDSGKNLIKEHKFFDYYLLGDYFTDLKEYKYALASYYKALEIYLTGNIFFSSEMQEIIYYKLTEILLIYRKHNFESKDLKFEIHNLINLHLLTNNYTNLENMQHLQMYHSIALVNQARFYNLIGYEEDGKYLLMNKKRDLLKDSAGILSEDNEELIGLIYKEIFTNNWKLDLSSPFPRERYADSIALLFNSFPSTARSMLNGNEDYIQEFSYLQGFSTNSWWEYQVAEMDESIRAKTAELNIFKGKLDSIKEVARGLDVEINEKIAELKRKELLYKQVSKDKDSLVIDTMRLRLNLTVLNDEIDEKEGQIKSLEWGIKYSIGALLVLVIISIASVVSLIRMKKNKVRLKQEINELEKTKDDLSYQVVSLNTTHEANMAASRAELMYKNEHVLRELLVKHEIVGVFDNLVDSFSYISDKDISKEEALLFEAKLKKLTLFATTYYKSIDVESYRTVDAEVFLAEQYFEFAKTRKNLNEVYFMDKRNHRVEDLLLPPHLINNFTKNALEKGRIEGESFVIEIDDEKVGNMYVLYIKDNGRGIGPDFNVANLSDKSTGIRNVQTQIDYYNLREDQKYTIQFDENSFLDRGFNETETGTIVKLVFIKKQNQV